MKRFTIPLFVSCLLYHCGASLETPFQIRTGNSASLSGATLITLADLSEPCQEVGRKRIWYWPWLFPMNSREVTREFLPEKSYRFRTVMTKADLAISVPGFLVGVATQTDVVEACDNKVSPSVANAVPVPELEERSAEMRPVQPAPAEFGDLQLVRPTTENSILFAPNDANVAVSELGKLKRILARIPVGDQNKFILIGHADRTGDRSNNLLLSWQRALSVARAFERLGVPRKRMLILAAGYDWPADIANNRRVEIVSTR